MTNGATNAHRVRLYTAQYDPLTPRHIRASLTDVWTTKKRLEWQLNHPKSPNKRLKDKN